MSRYALRFRLLPLAALLCVGSCLSTEGYYRYQDAGASGTAGTTGTAGSAGPGTAGAGSAGTTGSGGSSGGSAAGVTGTAGATGAAGRGGTTGAAGAAAGRGGTTGAAGRGGTTGTAGAVGTAGATGAVLFSDDFETGSDGWNFAGDPLATHTLVADSTQVFKLTSTVEDQSVGAAGSLAWGDQIVEARVKVLGFNGSSSSDIAAICARLTDVDHFYYFGIQSDGKAKIKVNNSGNSSLGSSIDIGFQLNTWYTLKLSVVGDKLTAYVNGAPVGAIQTNSELTVGAVGLMVQATNAEFDDVVVRAP